MFFLYSYNSRTLPIGVLGHEAQWLVWENSSQVLSPWRLGELIFYSETELFKAPYLQDSQPFATVSLQELPFLEMKFRESDDISGNTKQCGHDWLLYSFLYNNFLWYLGKQITSQLKKYNFYHTVKRWKVLAVIIRQNLW